MRIGHLELLEHVDQRRQLAALAPDLVVVALAEEALGIEDGELDTLVLHVGAPLREHEGVGEGHDGLRVLVACQSGTRQDMPYQDERERA